MEDISIKSAVVEIKVVRVGNKQMTKAVYKQITREHIFDKDGELLGEPLGIIKGQGPRIAVLWVKDGELRLFELSDASVERLVKYEQITFKYSLIRLEPLLELLNGLEQLFIAV